MKIRSRLLLTLLAGAAVTACSGSAADSSPTAPTQAGPALTALTITPVGGGTMIVGATAPITTSGALPSTGAVLGAFAQYSNGSGRYVEAAWTSSDEGVVRVAGSTLTATGRGTATLTATFEGRSDDEQFVVDGGIPGRWAGSYVVDQCGATSGSLHEVLCSAPQPGRSGGIAPVGATLPIAMEITESGTDLSGMVAFGQVQGALTGKNRGAGLFYLQGVIPHSGGAINITHWDAQVVKDTMQAFINYQVRINGLPGTGEVATHLVNVTRR